MWQIKNGHINFETLSLGERVLSHLLLVLHLPVSTQKNCLQYKCYDDSSIGNKGRLYTSVSCRIAKEGDEVLLPYGLFIARST